MCVGSKATEPEGQYKIDPNDTDRFVDWLAERVNESPASHLLIIPGIWEILSEEYNNEWLEHCWNGE